MTELAKPASGAPVSRSRRFATRLGQYLLLQAVIAALCFLALRYPLPEPPSRYLVDSFARDDRGATQAVRLPDFVPSRRSLNDPAVYTSQFTWTRGTSEDAWSVYVPRFVNGIEVIVNGIEILDSRRDTSANRPDRATPEIAVIPASLLREGPNDLVIRLYVWGRVSGFLDRLFVGPDDVLRPYCDKRTLLFVTLPIVFAAWQGILAVILIVLWAVRRHEPAYGALAAAMTLGAVQAFLPTVIDQPAHPRIDATLIASAPLESGFVLAFVILFFGRRWPRSAVLIFVPGIVLTLIGLFGSQEVLSQSFVLLGLPAISINLVLLAAVVAGAELRRRDVPSLLLGCAVTILMTCFAHDMLSVLQIFPDRRLFFSRLSYSAMLVAIGAGLTGALPERSTGSTALPRILRFNYAKRRRNCGRALPASRSRRALRLSRGSARG